MQDEYLNSLTNYNEAILLKRQEELYNSITRAFKFKNAKLYNSTKTSEALNSLPMFSKEGFINSPLISKKGYISVYNESLLDYFEDSYDSLKNYNLNLLNGNNFIISNSSNYLTPYSYSKVIDPFRADYEDTL
jgi:hypothetical protein